MKLRNAAYVFPPPTFYSSQPELLTLPQSFLLWLTLGLPRLGLQVDLAFPFRFHVTDPSDKYPRPNRVR